MAKRASKPAAKPESVVEPEDTNVDEFEIEDESDLLEEEFEDSDVDDDEGDDEDEGIEGDEETGDTEDPADEEGSEDVLCARIDGNLSAYLIDVNDDVSEFLKNLHEQGEEGATFTLEFVVMSAAEYDQLENA